MIKLLWGVIDFLYSIIEWAAIIVWKCAGILLYFLGCILAAALVVFTTLCCVSSNYNK